MKQNLIALAMALTSICVTANELIEETVIVGRHDTRTVELIDALSIAPDPATLLQKAPGANVAVNGPLSGIPQIRGLFGPRISVSLDDTYLAPAGPNWMDPPISYAATAQLESLTVYRGITPVSIAQESLGGVIVAKTRRMAFGSSDTWMTEGQLVSSAQSANGGYQVDADLQATSQAQRLRLAVMHQSGDDYAFPGGDLLPTQYERTRYDLGYGVRWGDHSLQVDASNMDTGESGTPALPMDIDYVTADMVDATYRFQGSESWSLMATVFGSTIDHGMTNHHLRAPPPSGGRYRRNTARTENRGFHVQAELSDESSTWRLGVDGFDERHNSDIDNPNNAMFFVVNFRDVERRIVGLYAEQDFRLTNRLRGEWGIRANRVSTSAGEVNGTPALMMPPAATLRDRFNEGNRSQRDNLIDSFGKLTWTLSGAMEFYSGIARKQRAPSYQERYLWLPLEATAGLADGQLYTGDMELDAETAYQFDVGVDYRIEGFSIQPRVFYQRIDNFIQGDITPNDDPAVAFVAAMNQMNGLNRLPPLRFANVDAELYGFDVDWRWDVADGWQVGGIVNVVRGKRRDVTDDLYRIAPPNASIWLTRQLKGLALTAETVLYAEQRDVSGSSREATTGGYGVLNIAASWALNDALAVSLGLDNALDKRYAPHLGGYNRAANPNVGLLQRLPAPGVNAFARVVYRF